MIKLNKVVKKRSDKQGELFKIEQEFSKTKKDLQNEIAELLRLEQIVSDEIDPLKVQVAERILCVKGNPFGKVDEGNTIADSAIVDIANDFDKLRKKYFGNKVYAGYYQRCDCEYGMGPGHGRVVDRIGLKNPELHYTGDDKDACIYYIKNYERIVKSN